jgi:hypothetical protein
MASRASAGSYNKRDKEPAQDVVLYSKESRLLVSKRNGFHCQFITHVPEPVGKWVRRAITSSLVVEKMCPYVYVCVVASSGSSRFLGLVYVAIRRGKHLAFAWKQ